MFNNRKQSYQTTGAEEVTLQQGLTAPSLYVDGDYRKIEQFLLSGAYVNTRSGSGKTPLMVAVRNNCDPEIVKLLLKSGADPNLRDSKGRTALMYAAGHSYMTTINLLLQAGSKIDEEEEHTGLTSLMFSLIKQREIQVVTGLIDAGADVVRAGTKQPTVAGSMNQKMGRDLKPGSRQHDQPTAIQFTIISSPSL